MPFHAFALPDAPGDGDNQALALNRTDGTVVNVSRGSLVWVFDGVVDQVNEAWALTNCRGCATQAVAFQVILVVGQADVVSPQNRAVAVNGSCAACVANAIARQLVLTLDVVPSDEELAQLASVWERVEATLQTIGTVPVVQLLADLDALELELVDVLAPSLAEASPPTTSVAVADAADPAVTDGSSAYETPEEDGATVAGDSTTGTGEATTTSTGEATTTGTGDATTDTAPTSTTQPPQDPATTAPNP
jgi:putative peptide zinc metalloprotease protein